MNILITTIGVCGQLFMQPYNLPEREQLEIITVVDQVGERLSFSTAEKVLTLAMMEVESGFRQEAASHAAAVGLMQVTKPALIDAVKICGLESTPDVHTLRGGVLAGMCYIKWLKDTQGLDNVLDLSIAYNAGPSRVSKPANKLPREAVDHAIKVQRNFNKCYGGV